MDLTKREGWDLSVGSGIMISMDMMKLLLFRIPFFVFCNQSMYMYTLAILSNFVHFEYEMDINV